MPFAPARLMEWRIRAARHTGAYVWHRTLGAPKPMHLCLQTCEGTRQCNCEGAREWCAPVHFSEPGA
eukprot:4013975-Alexandrium_andersonii.AAC.1